MKSCAEVRWSARRRNHVVNRPALGHARTRRPLGICAPPHRRLPDMRLVCRCESFYSWLRRVYRKPVGEHSISADWIVRGHMKPILDPFVSIYLEREYGSAENVRKNPARLTARSGKGGAGDRGRARQCFVDRRKDSGRPAMKRVSSALLSKLGY